MSEKTNKTLGQKRIHIPFDPTQKDIVDQIKDRSAELIDLIETVRTDGATGEKHRVISLAQTNIETACMYAVKANFVD